MNCFTIRICCFFKTIICTWISPEGISGVVGVDVVLVGTVLVVIGVGELIEDGDTNSAVSIEICLELDLKSRDFKGFQGLGLDQGALEIKGEDLDQVCSVGSKELETRCLICGHARGVGAITKNGDRLNVQGWIETEGIPGFVFEEKERRSTPGVVVGVSVAEVEIA